MTEYIDRQAAIKAFREHFEDRGDIMARVCEVILNDIPTADVRKNVRGKWIKDEYGYLVCSECDNEMPTLWSQGRIPEWTVRYCHYCGAQMEVMQNETE